MLIELLVVFVILGYLYSTGFLSFDSPLSIAFSIGLVLAGVMIGWLVAHFVARRLIDSLFGFDAWTPRHPLRLRGEAGTPPAPVPAEGPERLGVLAALVARAPDDKAASRMLADEHLARGDVDAFMREKLRIAGRGVLTREETVAVYHRLADAELARGGAKRAVEFLRTIIEKYPDSPEARNAASRIEVVVVHGDEPESRPE